MIDLIMVFIIGGAAVAVAACKLARIRKKGFGGCSGCSGGCSGCPGNCGGNIKKV